MVKRTGSITTWCRPDERLQDLPLGAQAIARIEKAIRRSRPGLEQQELRLEHLSVLSEEALLGAARGRGVTRGALEDLACTRKRVIDWLRPLGARAPLEPWRSADTELDEERDLERQHAEWLDSPHRAVWMSPRDLLLIDRLLESSGEEAAVRVRERLAESVESAREALSTSIDATPRPVIEWVEVPARYRVRIASDYLPMETVYRRWDAQIEHYTASVVRHAAKLGAANYAIYLDLDSRGERVVVDAQTFGEAERRLIEALAMRKPITRRPVVEPRREALPKGRVALPRGAAKGHGKP